jgi:sulfocyanin SoxE-like protein
MVQALHPSRLLGDVAFLAMLAGCAASSQSTPSTAPPPPPAPAPTAPGAPSAAEWLSIDSVGRTATLSLEVTALPGAPSALINGHRAGEARIVVPLGWTVKWNWRNADSTSRHSLVVMVQREKIPLEGGQPAFSNAMTRMLTEGLPPGQSDQTNFVADEAGWYWLLCGVPNHGLQGEWLELRVDQEARVPSVKVRQ